MSFRFAALLALLALSACGGGPPPVFAPLDYSYLPPITLKVTAVNITNDYVPSTGAAGMIAQDPVVPADVLMRTLQHRLIASGAPGTANVTLKDASIDQAGASLIGAMDVEVAVASPDGRSTGFVEAQTTVTAPAPDPNSSQADVQTALYNLTKQMMDGINVQLQYQLQHSLGNWIVMSGAGVLAPLGSNPAPTAIQATPLPSPGATAPAPSTGAPTPLLAPGVQSLGVLPVPSK